MSVTVIGNKLQVEVLADESTKTQLNETQQEVESTKTQLNEIQQEVSDLDSRVDTILTTPVESVSAQEIIDARQGEATLGANITEIKSQLADIPNQYVKGKRTAYNPANGEANITFGHETNAIADDVKNSVIIGCGANGYNNIIGGDGTETVNTVTPNKTIPGTVANVSVIGGYDNVAGSLSSKIISDHSYTEVGGQGHNAIYGGANHIAKSTANFAMIAGGNNNIVRGRATFATGLGNDVDGTGSAAFGTGNNISNNGSFVTGAGNSVTGGYSSAHGSSNSAEAGFSTAIGNYARSRTVGQQALTGGRFSALGDAQTSVIEMHRQTTDDSRVFLGILGSNNSHKMLPNQSATFSVLLVARAVGSNDTSGWKIDGVAMSGSSGRSTIIGTPIVTNLGASTGASTWLAEVFADSSGGINIAITGEAGKTIRWVQRMTLAEVMV